MSIAVPSRDTLSTLSTINGIATAILTMRIVNIALLIYGIYAYSLYQGYQEYKKVAHTYDMSTPYYVVHSPHRCQTLFNGVDLTVFKVERREPAYLKRDPKCAPIDAATLKRVVEQHEYNARGKNRKGFYFSYIVIFFFYGVTAFMAKIDGGEIPNISRTIRTKSVVVGWILISALLFPFIYRDTKNHTEITINGDRYWTQSAILSKDKTHIIYASSNFVSRISSMESGRDLNLYW